MTLRARVTVLVAVAVAVVVAATSVAAYAFARDEARSEIDTFLRTRGATAGFANALDPADFGRGPGQGPGPGAGRRVVEDDVLAQVVLPQTTVVVAGTG